MQQSVPRGAPPRQSQKSSRRQNRATIFPHPFSLSQREREPVQRIPTPPLPVGEGRGEGEGSTIPGLGASFETPPPEPPQKIALTQAGGHIFDKLRAWSAEDPTDMEDEIMRAPVRFTIFAVVSVVAIGQVALWLFPAVVQAQNNYGAIAYSSSTGRYGYSYDFGSRGEAEDYARSQCGRSDCVVKVWFKNACGALAVGQRGALGWGWSGSRGSAEDRALNECQSRTSACSVRTWACTTR